MVVLSVVGSFNGLACTLKLIKVKGKGIRFFARFNNRTLAALFAISCHSSKWDSLIVRLLCEVE